MLTLSSHRERLIKNLFPLRRRNSANTIVQINLTQKTLHFSKPLTINGAEQSEHHYIGIMMMDDKGQRIGMGECAPMPSLSPDIESYTRMSDVASLINEAVSSNDYSESLRNHPALLFALESAMYDYQHNSLLYDTPFALSQKGIPLIGNVFADCYEGMFAMVKKLIANGFRCIKIDATKDNWDDVMGVIRKVRSRFSEESIQLRVDANASLTLEEAEQKIKEMQSLGVYAIEQPIARYQWSDMAHLCKTSPIKIILDEELTGVNSIEEKRLLLDTIAPQFIVVRPTLHGGMAGAIEWISEAQKRGIGSWLGSAYEGNIGLRNIALLAARIYNIDNCMPQDINALAIYRDNIEMDIELRRNRLWRCEVDE